MACDRLDPGLGVVRGLLIASDCHAQTLAMSGYQALAGQGSIVPSLLAGVLGLYVAVQAARLLLGHPFNVGTWTLSLLKIGLVLALVTQWPVYERLVHNLFMQAPGQLAGTLTSAYRDEIGFGGELSVGLQRAYSELSAAAAVAAAPSQAAPRPASNGAAPPTPASASPTGPALTLKAAAFVLALSSLAPMVGAKLVLAALVALGPLVILLVLFDATRGLVTGWLRGLTGAGLTLLLSYLTLSVQLPLLTPVLQRLSRGRVDGVIDPIQASNALLLVSVFGLIAVSGVVAAAAMAGGLKLPMSRRPPSAQDAPQAHVAAPLAARSQVGDPSLVARRPTVSAALERRESRMMVTRDAAAVETGRRIAVTSSASFAASESPGPLRRTAATRRSSAADRRDG